MRNTSDQGRNAWGSYVKTARERVPMTGEDFVRRVGISRETLWRWESGKYKPSRPEVVQRAADVLGVDQEEALAAAGFRPTVQPPRTPTREPDPEIELIRTARISDAQKKALIKHVLERRVREQQTRLAELEMIVRAQERGR